MSNKLKNLINGILNKSGNAMFDYGQKAIDYLIDDGIPKIRRNQMKYKPQEYFLTNYALLKGIQLTKKTTDKIVPIIEQIDRKPLDEQIRNALKLRDTRSLTNVLSDTINKSMNSHAETRKPLTEQLNTAIKLRSNNKAPSINNRTVEKKRDGR